MPTIEFSTNSRAASVNQQHVEEAAACLRIESEVVIDDNRASAEVAFES
jgi:hypothetical protein